MKTIHLVVLTLLMLCLAVWFQVVINNSVIAQNKQIIPLLARAIKLPEHEDKDFANTDLVFVRTKEAVIAGKEGKKLYFLMAVEK